MHEFVADGRGASAVTLAALLPILVGVVGLAVDVGVWQMNKRKLQGAVDQAVFSAALASGKDETDIQAETEGKAIMASMGFADGVNGVAVTFSNPPSLGTHTSDPDAWEVTATKTQTLMFAGLFLDAAPTIRARAVAIRGTDPGSACILTLDAAASGSTIFTNNADVTNQDCAVYTNSSHARALQCDNNCDIASNTYTVGGNYVTNHGTLSGQVNATGVSPATDPYLGTTAPSNPTCTTNTSVTANAATLTISPGVYCGGINFTGNKTLVMLPGTYYIKSKFNISNNATLNAYGGVTIVLLNNLCVGDGTCEKEKGIGNNVTLNIEAPTSGPYAGIAIFAAGTSGTNKLQEFSNNVDMNIQGALYAPYHTFSFHNNAQFDPNVCAQVVSLRVSFENNADMGTECDNTGVKPIAGGSTPTVMAE